MAKAVTDLGWNLQHLLPKAAMEKILRGALGGLHGISGDRGALSPPFLSTALRIVFVPLKSS
jgi:hypothetical protein